MKKKPLSKPRAVAPSVEKKHSGRAEVSQKKAVPRKKATEPAQKTRTSTKAGKSPRSHSVAEAIETTWQGKLSVHPRGFGFLPRTKGLGDLFIPRSAIGEAVDGDLVVVELIPGQEDEARIVRILERSRKRLVGIIRRVEDGEFFAYIPVLGPEWRIVVESQKPLEVGDRVILTVDRWGSRTSITFTSLVEIIGPMSDPRYDLPAILQEYELPHQFPEEVVSEARRCGKRVSAEDCAAREDLRDLTCITIDPATAKDFDDALSLTQDKKGNYHLGVHIADVSHYVREGTALDREARRRANSTYFPGSVIPMLPHELSDGLCSLRPLTNRLAVSVLMTFNRSGKMLSYRLTRSVIRSKKRFSYEEAKELLDGTKSSPYTALIRLLSELCLLLKEQRTARGSVDLALPDLVVQVDAEGSPQGLLRVEYDITHQLVEECMLKANEVIARHLAEEGKNLTYRIHDEPNAENLAAFATFAGTLGFKISSTPTIKEMQKLFVEASETPFVNWLATAYIRKMRMAIYSIENRGHYGLALSHYSHFTSPIRRYIDLVIHRLLFGGSDDPDELDAISRHCSDSERRSARAENDLTLLKKLRYLDRIRKNEPHKSYEALVSEVKKFGITFEIPELLTEGFIHVAELGNDYFFFEESKQRLIGRQTRKTYQHGSKLSVELKAVDFIFMKSFWQICSEPGLLPRENGKQTKKPSENLLKKSSRR